MNTFNTLCLIVAVCIVTPFLVTVTAATLETMKHEHTGFLKTFISEFRDDLKLIIRILFVHRFSIRTLKHLQQIGLYFLEIFTVCGLLLLLEYFFYPIEPEHFWYELLIRFLTTYTAYQIFVFSVMNLINSARYDEWLAVVRIAKLQKLYNKTGTDYTLEELNKRIDESLNPYTFMMGDPKKFVTEIKDGVSEEYLDYILIIAEHQVQALSSFWHFSFLLDAIK